MPPWKTCALALAIGASIAPAALPAAESTLSRPRLHRQATTERSWVANACWLESETGVVVVDTLFLKPDVDALIAAIRLTGKPVAGILVTHPHGDHFGGVPRLRDAFGDVPVYATRATADGVARTFKRIVNAPWTRRFGDEFPKTFFTPNHIVASGQTIELAGMHFTFTDLGAMESDDNAVIENSETRAIFSGDATVYAAAYYVGEGHSCGALAGLQALRGSHDASRMLYSGHYAAMRLGTVVDDDIRQVRFLRGLMHDAFAVAANRSENGDLTDAAREVLVEKAAAFLGDHADYGIGPRDYANGVNLPGLEAEIKQELESGKACVADRAE